MRSSSLLAALLVLALPVLSAAQETSAPPRAPRAGFWISFGVAGAPNQLYCDELCTDDFGQGSAGYLALGGTLDQQWQIGGELLGFFPWSGWDEGYDADTNGFGAALFTARHYPRPDGNFFVSGGLGIGEVDVQEDGVEATGYVGKLGVGYDLRVGRTFSFTPFAALVRTFGSQARTQLGGDELDEAVNFGMAMIGIGFTWY